VSGTRVKMRCWAENKWAWFSRKREYTSARFDWPGLGAKRQHQITSIINKVTDSREVKRTWRWVVNEGRYKPREKGEGNKYILIKSMVRKYGHHTTRILTNSMKLHAANSDQEPPTDWFINQPKFEFDWFSSCTCAIRTHIFTAAPLLQQKAEAVGRSFVVLQALP